jgi:hypothetical protein
MRSGAKVVSVALALAMLLCAPQLAFAAGHDTGLVPQTAAAIRSQGVWLPSVTNGEAYFDLLTLRASPLDGKPYTAADLTLSISVLERLQGARIRDLQNGEVTVGHISRTRLGTTGEA